MFINNIKECACNCKCSFESAAGFQKRLNSCLHVLTCYLECPWTINSCIRRCSWLPYQDEEYGKFPHRKEHYRSKCIEKCAINSPKCLVARVFRVSVFFFEKETNPISSGGRVAYRKSLVTAFFFKFF